MSFQIMFFRKKFIKIVNFLSDLESRFSDFIMAERSNQIVDLINYALHGDQQQINNATSELQKAYSQIDTINDFLNIAQNYDEPIVRRFAAISIRQMINIHELDQEQTNFIKMALLSLIQNDPDLLNKQAFFEAAILLQKKLAQPWEDLYNTALNFLSAPESLAVGLQVWTSLIHNSNSSIAGENILLNYFQTLMNCIISSFQTPDANIIILSIHLFSALTTKIELKLFSTFTDLQQLFLNEASASVKDRPNIQEAQEIFLCVCDQLSLKNPLFVQISEPFVNLALQITVSDLDPELRSTCQPLVSMSPKLFPDLVESQLPIFLQSELTLAVQLVSKDRELVSHDIEFITDFVYSVAVNTESSSSLVQGLLTFAQNSITSPENGPESLQVALLSLSFILSASCEDFFDHIETVSEIVMFSLSSDHFIFDACCEFLLSAAEQCPQLYQEYYNKIVSVLFSKICQESRSLQTLDALICNSDQPPAGYMALLSALASLLQESNPERYEPIISCMTSVISKIKDVNDEIYTNMRTMLVSLLSSEKVDTLTRAKIFECFGQLAKVSPLVVQQDVPELMKGMLQAMMSNGDENSIENKDSLNESIAECIQNMAKVIPMSIQPYLEKIIPFFMKLLTIETEKNNIDSASEKVEDFNDDEYEEDFLPIKMQCTVLNALAELVSDLPSQMSEAIPGIVEAVRHFFEHSDERLHSAAAKSILLMNDGLRFVSYDISPLITIVAEQIINSNCLQESIDVISELFIALGSLLSVTTFDKLNQTQIESIIGLFQQSFDGRLKVIYSSQKVLDQEILDSLFFSLRMFILTLGSNIGNNNLADIFVSFLCPHLSINKSMIKAYVANIYGIMFFAAPSLKQIGKTARDTCLKTMTKKNGVVNNLLISTLNYIIHADKSLFNQKQITALQNQCDAIIGNRENMDSFIVSTAITTWCSICISFDLKPSDNDLNVVLSLLPPVVDDDDIPFTAQFIFLAHQKWPELTSPHIQRICVNVFASGEWCLRIVPPEVMHALASVVAAIPQDQLQIFVKYNQHLIFQIQSNLSRFSN